MTSNTCLENYDEKAKDPNVKVFSASWDRGTWALNLGIFTFNAMLTIMFLIIASKNPANKIPMTIGAIFIVICTILPAVWAPIKYIVTEQKIIIKRIGPEIIIPLADVCTVSCMPYDEVFCSAIRTMGSGGVFGIYGNYKSASMGKFKAYMTRRDKLVLIRTLDKPFVITPDKPEDFIAAVQQKGKV